MSAAEWEAWCDATAVEDEPPALLAEHRGAAEDLMDRAHDLAVKLPGTLALFLAGRRGQVPPGPESSRPGSRCGGP
jgi:hypothetical protein